MSEAQKQVWEGAIPLQIRLHQSEVTTLPPPPPALVCLSNLTLDRVFSFQFQTSIQTYEPLLFDF